MLRRPLQQPYDGPFKVLQRKDKVFFLDINGKRVSVSIDRCKPAFFLNTEDLQLPQTKNETPATGTLMQQLQHLLLWNLIQQLQRPTQPSTRSGRKVHLPTRKTVALSFSDVQWMCSRALCNRALLGDDVNGTELMIFRNMDDFHAAIGNPVF
ncbi:hypothetical protein TNCV_3844101 [Trichonephila clavipes]|nr:hypothetical protein TNCV_3844101 [Trichonephila clavipes]